MLYLSSYEIRENKRRDAYCFRVPAIAHETRREFTSSVTFFEGENGSGKSTLLEALARSIGMPALGANDTRRDHTLEAVDPLANALKLSFKTKPKYSFFLRAEDFFGFIQRIRNTRESMRKELDAIDREYAGRSDYAKSLAAMPYASSITALDSRYGENPDAQSHGESFMSVFSSRMHESGLYLLDEPEAALSPTRQLALLSMLDELRGSSQFIIATHSPILLSLPSAEIPSFKSDGIIPAAYSDLDSIEVLRSFLRSPERYHKLLGIDTESANE